MGTSKSSGNKSRRGLKGAKSGAGVRSGSGTRKGVGKASTKASTKGRGSQSRPHGNQAAERSEKSDRGKATGKAVGKAVGKGLKKAAKPGSKTAQSSNRAVTRTAYESQVSESNRPKAKPSESTAPELSMGSAPKKVTFIEVPADYAGQRLDNYLFNQLKGVPKSKVYRIIRKGELRANGRRVKPDYRLVSGDKLRVPPIRVSQPGETELPSKEFLYTKLPLDQLVIFESKELLVVNKPAGIAVHGGSGLQWGVIEALRVLRDDIHFLELVHRLDRDTSGVLLLAKKRSVLKALHQALAVHELEKYYQALLVGNLAKGRTTVDLPLEKNIYQGGERMVRVARDGKPAVTHVEVLRRFKAMSWVEVKLETGRTHQIRVHTQYLGHPIVGDTRYGQEAFNQSFKQTHQCDRMWLHAAKLVIPENVSQALFDRREAMVFSAPWDQKLLDLLETFES